MLWETLRANILDWAGRRPPSKLLAFLRDLRRLEKRILDAAHVQAIFELQIEDSEAVVAQLRNERASLLNWRRMFSGPQVIRGRTRRHLLHHVIVYHVPSLDQPHASPASPSRRMSREGLSQDSLIVLVQAHIFLT